MGFSNVIYEQAPSPNPMGAALVSAAGDIGTGIKSAQEIRNKRDEQLVTMAMTMLPRMAENPEMLKQFTNHPDFMQHIMPAFNRMKLGSVFSKTPQGDWSLNIPPDKQTIDEILGGYVQQGKMDIQTAIKMKAEASMTTFEKYLQQEQAKNLTGANDPKPTEMAKTLAMAQVQGTPDNYENTTTKVMKKGIFGTPIGQQTRQVPALAQVLARHGINAEEHFQERGMRKINKATEAASKKKASKIGAAIAARR